MIHASHKAVFSGGALKDFGTVCRRRIEGFAETRDAYGEKISPEMTAPGYCLVEVNPGCVKKTVTVPEGETWLQALPPALGQGFYRLNAQYGKIYQEKVKQRIKAQKKKPIL